MSEAPRVFEFSFRGQPALWFCVEGDVTFSTDEPYGRPYSVRGKVGRAFGEALDAMRRWVQAGGDLAALPAGWSFLCSVDRFDAAFFEAASSTVH